MNLKEIIKAKEIEHLRNLLLSEKRVEKLFNSTLSNICNLLHFGNFEIDKVQLSDYPILEDYINKEIARLNANLFHTINTTTLTSWQISEDKNKQIVDYLLSKKQLLPQEVDNILNPNYEGLKAFQARQVQGLNLSQRVWKISNQFKAEVSESISAMIIEGKGAEQIVAPSQSKLREFLRYPDKRFRRIRDEYGRLYLSKNALTFHPGQGVYRSSYMNARRLAVAEGSIAYHSADYDRWQKMDFIVGVEISLSNNHTCMGSDGKPHPFTDICDELKGRYPKDFKFVGWHPHCRCRLTPIFATDKERKINRQRQSEGQAPISSENAVTQMPQQFESWRDQNEDRIKRSKNLPYFLKDNPQRTRVEEILGGKSNEDIVKQELTPYEKQN